MGMTTRKATCLFRNENVLELMLQSYCAYTSSPLNRIPSTFINPLPCRSGATISMQADMNNLIAPNVARAIADRKHALRSKLRRDLKAFSSQQRQDEDNAIQSIILESSWFKSASALCAYISCSALKEVDTSRIISEVLSSADDGSSIQTNKKLYVPRVEDKNSNMRMLNISSRNDLIANSMKILEPSPIDISGNPREDVLLASEPVDLFLLPGLAFDHSGQRLGRGGGYYDAFLKKYQTLVNDRKWKRPLLVALAYSVQVMDDGVIPVTPDDVPVDALITASGVVNVSGAALERM